MATDKATSPAPEAATAAQTAPVATSSPAPEPNLQEPAIIQADDDESDDTDADSSLGDDAVSSTASISSSIMNYRRENGRTYHAYRDGKYLIPNDEQENERLDFQHHLWYLTLDGRLGWAPPAHPDAKGGRVLDVGTGTGIWAIDYGDEHPDAHVIGVDLSPIQPNFTPPNVHFQIDDLEDEWTFSQPFDYIHVRAMSGSIKNWSAFLERCFENLKPGGWLEIQEPGRPIADDDSFPPDCALAKATALFAEGLKAAGSPLLDVFTLKDLYDGAGFVNYEEKRAYWPSNPWPKDKKLKEIAMWSNTNLSAGVEGFLMAVATRFLGWSLPEVAVLSAQARADLNDRKIHAYWPVTSAFAQKPE
ncbi:S-adenosyl-L-methionine-dependent methyltransferase [Triangularia setosa]|uniref:S-adenosyl-L-methionine-dependent methyltransferase n=1 Tax=Triangularia setosa TaxID=2587417 RepID=A0AAN6WGW5_9PEZI|nr:S-adenosyl-L-methionine-dependent methyltransferase [Podospora setosa]